MFQNLENRYEFSNKNVLDLFSGTGSIAYEFLSRGCTEATMVEINFVHYKFILNVLEVLKIENAKIKTIASIIIKTRVNFISNFF